MPHWNVKLHAVPDEAVWQYAREHDFTIVSKDADFSDISMELGYPPKLIWLQIENWSTDQVERLIRSAVVRILDLATQADRGIIVYSGGVAAERMYSSPALSSPSAPQTAQSIAGLRSKSSAPRGGPMQSAADHIVTSSPM